MANKERGEIALDVKGRSYTLRLDMNALCELESALSTGGKEVTFHQALRMVERQHLGATRALLWAGLRAHHPDLTIVDVGNLMLEMGGIQDIEAQLKAAVEASMPTKSDEKAAGTARPQEARRPGRGARSVSEPDRSASAATTSGG